jgi:hypothetical protein
MMRGAEACSACRTTERRLLKQAQNRERYAEDIRLTESYLESFKRLEDEPQWAWSFGMYEPHRFADAVARRREDVHRRLSYLRRLCGEDA